MYKDISDEMHDDINNGTYLRNLRHHLMSGGQVLVYTYPRPTMYDKRHVKRFGADADGLYLKRGKEKEYLNDTEIRWSA